MLGTWDFISEKIFYISMYGACATWGSGSDAFTEFRSSNIPGQGSKNEFYSGKRVFENGIKQTIYRQSPPWTSYLYCLLAGTNKNFNIKVIKIYFWQTGLINWELSQFKTRRRSFFPVIPPPKWSVLIVQFRADLSLVLNYRILFF